MLLRPREKEAFEKLFSYLLTRHTSQSAHTDTAKRLRRESFLHPMMEQDRPSQSHATATSGILRAQSSPYGSDALLVASAQFQSRTQTALDFSCRCGKRYRSSRTLSGICVEERPPSQPSQPTGSETSQKQWMPPLKSQVSQSGKSNTNQWDPEIPLIWPTGSP